MLKDTSPAPAGVEQAERRVDGLDVPLLRQITEIAAFERGVRPVAGEKQRFGAAPAARGATSMSARRRDRSRGFASRFWRGDGIPGMVSPASAQRGTSAPTMLVPDAS